MRILLLGSYRPSLVDRLTARHDVQCIESYDSERVHDALTDARLVVLRSPHRITDEMLSTATGLRWIIRAGSGTDNISDAHRRHGVEVFTTPLNSWSVAELAFAMLFSLYRDLRPLHRSLREGRWEKFDATGREVRGGSVGILGFGRIGEAVADIASNFDMTIRAFDHRPRVPRKRELAAEFDVEFAGLEHLLAQSDVVVVCLPLTDETAHLLDRDALELMRDDAVLVNVARGAIVDLDALSDSLERGALGGAGLDVYPNEPPGAHPIFERDDVVCTPHVGAQTREARTRIDRRILELVDELERDGDSP